VNSYVPKIALEERRLAELDQIQHTAVSGGNDREGRRLAKEHDVELRLLEELRRFRDALKEAVDFGYDPDLDDGVVLAIAPLHKLVPWKEAAAYWKDLLGGKYAWSTVAEQLAARRKVAAP